MHNFSAQERDSDKLPVLWQGFLLQGIRHSGLVLQGCL